MVLFGLTHFLFPKHIFYRDESIHEKYRKFTLFRLSLTHRSIIEKNTCVYLILFQNDNSAGGKGQKQFCIKKSLFISFFLGGWRAYSIPLGYKLGAWFQKLSPLYLYLTYWQNKFCIKSLKLRNLKILKTGHFGL